MKFLQKLGKALMLPVAVLPICGILMGIGYRLCPATMQGGDISGVVNLIGLFLVKAGAALIDNMAILFAIGVGVGMSEKNDGTGGIAALASWLMITTLLSTGVVTTIIPSIAESATKTLAFDKIQNPFIGILAGIIGSACYNRFKDTKLPDWLSFFSGKRCVAIVSGVVSIVVSAVLLLVWPLLFGALVAIGKSIVSLDVVGAGIYAFLNRLLIPTGLHHALNNVFWFDTIGLGDLKHFWAGETSADVTWSLGMYMSGFFPCMMFGIPGAALAMVRCAKPAKKKAAIGLVVPRSGTLRCIRITVWYLYYDHSCSRLPCRIQLLRRCYGPPVLILTARSTENMADHSAWNRSIPRILLRIPVCYQEMGSENSWTRR